MKKANPIIPRVRLFEKTGRLSLPKKLKESVFLNSAGAIVEVDENNTYLKLRPYTPNTCILCGKETETETPSKLCEECQKFYLKDGNENE